MYSSSIAVIDMTTKNEFTQEYLRHLAEQNKLNSLHPDYESKLNYLLLTLFRNARKEAGSDWGDVDQIGFEVDYSPHQWNYVFELLEKRVESNKIGIVMLNNEIQLDRETVHYLRNWLFSEK